MHSTLLLTLLVASSFAVSHPMRVTPDTVGSRLTSNPNIPPQGTSEGFDSPQLGYHNIDTAKTVQHAAKAIILQRRALGI